MFIETLSVRELSLWRLLKSVLTHVLGNKQSAECKKAVDELIRVKQQQKGEKPLKKLQ